MGISRDSYLSDALISAVQLKRKLFTLHQKPQTKLLLVRFHT